MVIADVLGLNPNIAHDLSLQSLRKSCNVPTKKIISVAEFLLKSNYFDFNENFAGKRQDHLFWN